MFDKVRETPCTRCVHLNVCIHKNDFLDIYKAVYDIEIYKGCKNGGVSAKKITNYECLGEIRIDCRYFMSKN